MLTCLNVASIAACWDVRRQHTASLSCSQRFEIYIINDLKFESDTILPTFVKITPVTLGIPDCRTWRWPTEAAGPKPSTTGEEGNSVNIPIISHCPFPARPQSRQLGHHLSRAAISYLRNTICWYPRMRLKNDFKGLQTCRSRPMGWQNKRSCHITGRPSIGERRQGRDY